MWDRDEAQACIDPWGAKTDVVSMGLSNISMACLHLQEQWNDGFYAHVQNAPDGSVMPNSTIAKLTYCRDDDNQESESSCSPSTKTEDDLMIPTERWIFS